MTRLPTDQVDQLVLLVYADMGFTPGRRRAVGPYRAVIVVLLYLRHCDDGCVARGLGLTPCATGFVP
jgi:hypothetical protein